MLPVNVEPAIDGKWIWRGRDVYCLEVKDILPVGTKWTVTLPSGPITQLGES